MPFPPFISQKPGEIPVFGTFRGEILNFDLCFTEKGLFLGSAMCLCHYDVIPWMFVLILICIERGDLKLYYNSLVAYVICGRFVNNFIFWS